MKKRRMGRHKREDEYVEKGRSKEIGMGSS
jgi:hypothetical protein